MARILLVSGSRTIEDVDFVFDCLDEIRKECDFNTIMEGGANGVDSLAGLYARTRNFGHITKYAQWNTYGKKAGILRNIEMVKECDYGIAIWDGKSPGTKHCIGELKKANKLLKVFVKT